MIHISDLKLFHQKKLILELEKLCVPEKGLHLICGDNGSGKSTLLKSMVFLHQEFSGEIKIDGRDVRLIPRRETAKILSYLPQNSSGKTGISGKDFIEQSLYSARSSGIGRIVSALKIEHLMEKPLSKMSGGELQLCRLARALLPDVRYTLLDEPETYLSKKNRERFLALADEISGERSIVIVSHLPEKEIPVLLELWED